MNTEQTFLYQLTNLTEEIDAVVLSTAKRNHNEFILHTATFRDFQVMMLHNPDSKNPNNQTWLVWEFESKLNGMGQSLKDAYSDLMDQNLKHSLAAMYDRLY